RRPPPQRGEVTANGTGGRAAHDGVLPEDRRPPRRMRLEECVDLVGRDGPWVDVATRGEGVRRQEWEQLVLECGRDRSLEDLVQLQQLGRLDRSTEMLVQVEEAAARRGRLAVLGLLGQVLDDPACGDELKERRPFARPEAGGVDVVRRRANLVE